MSINKLQKNKGFVLFFSLLVTSIILAAGLAVSRIVVRQILLASVQKDSQMSLFAADAGIECARYWRDTKSNPTLDNTSGDLTCNSMALIKDVPDPIHPTNVRAWFNLGSQNPPADSCVIIEIYNESNPSRVCGNGSDKRCISAKGYNVPCNASTGAPEGGRVVERGLRFTYQ